MTIVIADDHPIYRQGLLKVLERTSDCRVVGEASDGALALDLITTLHPDIAVLDIAMPQMEGLEVMKRAFTDEHCVTEFIILTMFKEEAYFTEAMDLGAKGYLLKENAPSDLVACIRAVADGIPYVSPLVSQYLVRRTAKLRAHNRRPSVDDLTTQERRILKLVSLNKTSREIAGELNLSVRTVQHHRSNICTKLELEGYNKLLQFAMEHKDML